MPLLDIRNLTIDIITPTGRLKVVDRITLTLSEGEFRGVVGESGSGKSLIAKVICGLTNENWIISADRFRFNNIELLKLSASERRKLVGCNISMIFQEPQSCLDPAEHIGKQLTQAIPSWTYKGAWYKRFGWRKKRAIALLHRVGIKEHHEIMNCYPHQLTEGECQKVMIAIALANQPRLLIADEPTNAMESTTQAQIFRLLASMNQNNHTTILLISHNLEMMVRWASRVSVLYCGQMVEIADSQELLKFPQHPYTLALIRSTPELVQSLAPKSPLNTIPGSIPALENLPIGCRFGPRCPYAQKDCMQRPKLSLGKNHAFACHYPLNTESGG